MRAPAHFGEIVRNHVAAEHIALVDNGVEFVGSRKIGHADRIAHTGSVDRLFVGREFDLQYRGTLFFRLHAIFADITVRTDRNIEMIAVFAGEQTTGPMVIGLFGIQIGNLAAFSRNFRIAFSIGIGVNCVGIGDVQRIVDQLDSEWRVEIFEESEFLVDLAILVTVAQQHDPVCRFGTSAGLAHQIAHYPAFDSLVRPRRAIGFSHQKIAIGQTEHAPRMIKAFGEALNHKPLGCNRSFSCTPWLGFRDIDCRKTFRADIRQRRFHPCRRIQWQAGCIATHEIISCTYTEDDKQNRDISDMFQHDAILDGVKGPDKRALLCVATSPPDYQRD